MIPILYDSKETAFTTQGLGRLSEAYDFSVKWELNGTYEASFSYPTSSKHFNDIKVGRLVWCDPYPDGKKQAFRIYEIDKSMEGSIDVSCEHISYGLNNIPVSPYQAKTANAALTGIKQQSLCDNPFTLQTNLSVSGDFQLADPTMARTVLCGGDSSIQAAFGGELFFDNYSVYLVDAIGKDNGAILRYGKNITDLKQEENIQDTITGVVPFYKTDDGNLIYLPEKVLYSDNASGFSYTKIGLLDCADMKGDADNYTPTTDALRTYAKQWMVDNNVGVPSISISVSYVDLEQENLTEIHPGDTVGVLFVDLGINKKAEVVGYEYDVIAERYNSVTIGDLFPDLAVTLLKQMGTDSTNIKKDVDAIKSTVTTVQNNVNAVQDSSAYLEYGNSGTEVTLSTTAATVTNSNVTETDTYNAASDGLTIKQSGRYMVVVNATFQGTGNAHFSILLNGTEVQTTSTYISGVSSISASAIVVTDDNGVLTFTESCDSGQTIKSTGVEKISIQKLA
jgi:phage minor structural protein